MGKHELTGDGHLEADYYFDLVHKSNEEHFGDSPGRIDNDSDSTDDGGHESTPDSTTDKDAGGTQEKPDSTPPDSDEEPADTADPHAHTSAGTSTPTSTLGDPTVTSDSFLRDETTAASLTDAQLEAASRDTAADLFDDPALGFDTRDLFNLSNAGPVEGWEAVDSDVMLDQRVDDLMEDAAARDYDFETTEGGDETGDLAAGGEGSDVYIPPVPNPIDYPGVQEAIDSFINGTIAPMNAASVSTFGSNLATGESCATDFSETISAIEKLGTDFADDIADGIGGTYPDGGDKWQERLAPIGNKLSDLTSAIGTLLGEEGSQPHTMSALNAKGIAEAFAQTREAADTLVASTMAEMDAAAAAAPPGMEDLARAQVPPPDFSNVSMHLSSQVTRAAEGVRDAIVGQTDELFATPADDEMLVSPDTVPSSGGDTTMGPSGGSTGGSAGGSSAGGSTGGGGSAMPAGGGSSAGGSSAGGGSTSGGSGGGSSSTSSSSGSSDRKGFTREQAEKLADVISKHYGGNEAGESDTSQGGWIPKMPDDPQFIDPNSLGAMPQMPGTDTTGFTPGAPGSMPGMGTADTTDPTGLGGATGMPPRTETTGYAPDTSNLSGMMPNNPAGGGGMNTGGAMPGLGGGAGMGTSAGGGMDGGMGAAGGMGRGVTPRFGGQADPRGEATAPTTSTSGGFNPSPGGSSTVGGSGAAGAEVPGSTTTDTGGGDVNTTDSAPAGDNAPDAAGTPDGQSESTTVDVDGATAHVDVDNPVIAEMMQDIADNATEDEPITLTEAAENAGVPTDSLGEPLEDPTDAKPGDVFASEKGRGFYMGDGQVLMEDGEVKEVKDVLKFNPPEEGIFRLDIDPDAIDTPDDDGEDAASEDDPKADTDDTDDEPDDDAGDDTPDDGDDEPASEDGDEPAEEPEEEPEAEMPPAGEAIGGAAPVEGESLAAEPAAEEPPVEPASLDTEPGNFAVNVEGEADLSVNTSSAQFDASGEFNAAATAGAAPAPEGDPEPVVEEPAEEPAEAPEPEAESAPAPAPAAPAEDNEDTGDATAPAPSGDGVEDADDADQLGHIDAQDFSGQAFR